jgi:hypothetical protein
VVWRLIGPSVCGAGTIVSIRMQLVGWWSYTVGGGGVSCQRIPPGAVGMLWNGL